MKIIIVGAGLGGLACAIACRRRNLDVLVLEQSPEILPGSKSPNGTRIMQELNLLPHIEKSGLRIESMDLRRYSDGRIIVSMPCGETVLREYAAPWMVIHRADYQSILLEEARRLGVEVRLCAAVERVIVDETGVVVDGEVIVGDVIIGADGLWSKVRESILDDHHPEETGDVAYRATFTRAQLLALHDADITALCEKRAVAAWLGPKKHAVFYPVRGGKEYNLVLIQGDDLPPGVRATQGDVDEIRDGYGDWDPLLGKMISCIGSVLKWKLCHLPELPTWTKGAVTLLGDACHPTLPYQAQGAAMAVEDGAALGMILGHIADDTSKIPRALKLYEDLRKSRTAQNVHGGMRNRNSFHLEDGILQKRRDLVLSVSEMTRETDWIGMMSSRQRAVLGFDVLEEFERRMPELD